jgi:phosphoribosyl 1,2-cyclic phosphodiesterase
VKVTIWGSRGSIAAPGPETLRYGGNTACVSVAGADGTLVVLDAGTGIRRLGASLRSIPPRVDVLLSHLHLDHLIGLGFFRPLRTPGCEVHIWGPASATMDLRTRLSRYLSPPLFPVFLRDVECDLTLHEVPAATASIGGFVVQSDLICHPDPTVGYRVSSPDGVLAYLTDHEPALGVSDFPATAEWTSGYAIAADADLLFHDCQYDDEEYAARQGWGHSSLRQAFAFAQLARVRELVTFHHDPGHTDGDLDLRLERAIRDLRPTCTVTEGREGREFALERRPAAAEAT